VDASHFVLEDELSLENRARDLLEDESSMETQFEDEIEENPELLIVNFPQVT